MSKTINFLKDWGTMRFESPLRDYLESLKDGKYQVEIKRKAEKRSLPKLRYFHWPVLLYIAEETGMIHEGMPPDEVQKQKEVLKMALKIKYRQFFPTTWARDPFRKWKRLTERKGMADISDEECGKFLKALSLDWNIPEPDTGNAMAFYEAMMNRYP